jgi:hypothetical protein
VRLRLWGEHRRHKLVRIEIAFEAKFRTITPAGPDLAQRQHELPHTPHRLTPRHAKPLLDVRLYLRAKPENESAVRVRLQIPPDVGHCHGIAGERHCDAGPQFDARRVLGGKHQRQEWIVVDLGSPAAVVASPLQLARGLGDVGELAGHGPVDLVADVATHDRRRYSKQFSMVNVNMPVRRSPSDDRSGA